MVIVEAHRIMAVDKAAFPDDCALIAHGHEAVTIEGDILGAWTSICKRGDYDQPGAAGLDLPIACTVPGGYVEIYGAWQ